MHYRDCEIPYNAKIDIIAVREFRLLRKCTWHNKVFSNLFAIAETKPRSGGDTLYSYLLTENPIYDKMEKIVEKKEVL